MWNSVLVHECRIVWRALCSSLHFRPHYFGNLAGFVWNSVFYLWQQFWWCIIDSSDILSSVLRRVFSDKLCILFSPLVWKFDTIDWFFCHCMYRLGSACIVFHNFGVVYELCAEGISAVFVQQPVLPDYRVLCHYGYRFPYNFDIHRTCAHAAPATPSARFRGTPHSCGTNSPLRLDNPPMRLFSGLAWRHTSSVSVLTFGLCDWYW